MSVDRAGQVSLRAGSGSPCELSGVTRSTVPDTKKSALHERPAVTVTSVTQLDHVYIMELSTLTCHSATQTPRAYCSVSTCGRSCLPKAHHQPPRPPSLWVPSRASGVQGVASPCELSDVTRSTVPDTRVRYTRDK